MEQIPKFTNSIKYKCLEHISAQSIDLYLSYCGIEECDSGHIYGPATRSEYLFHYIIEGKGTYYTNKKSYPLKKGNAFVIYPDKTTTYKADEKEPWTYLWIGFNGIRAEACLSCASFSFENPVSFFQNGAELINYTNALLEARHLTYADELKRTAYLHLFLSALIAEKSKNFNNKQKNYDYPQEIYVKHALDFIEDHIHQNIKINDIANYIGISRNYLTNSFKKYLNMSPQQYLINYRIKKASNLLKTTNHPINQIASDVGYDDAFAFSKIFKAYTGKNPKAYRESQDTIIEASKKGE